jgi:CheY-like chemotaxis protein
MDQKCYIGVLWNDVYLHCFEQWVRPLTSAMRFQKLVGCSYPVVFVRRISRELQNFDRDSRLNPAIFLYDAAPVADRRHHRTNRTVGSRALVGQGEIAVLANTEKHTKTILIVDDDELLVRGLGTRLKYNGYKVIVALDAITAIYTTRKETPDLVILDLGLPVGDGFDFLGRLRSLRRLSEYAATPVIVLSGRDPGENKQRALDAGAVAYFQKPPNSQELLVAIHHALGDSPASPSFLTT